MVFGLIFNACGSGSSGSDNGEETDDDNNNGDNLSTDCTYEPAESLYDGGSSGNGESTRTTALTNLVESSDITYLGAFRLPGEEGREGSFSYGGNAMTYYPENDSLYISGHDRIAFEFAEGNQVAEVSIPEPVESDDIGDLPTATFLQNFADVTGGLFGTYDEIPRMGLAYINVDDSPRIYLSFGQHFHESAEDQVPTHASFDPDLSEPDTVGAWFVDDRPLYSVNGFMFDLDTTWADEHVSGRYLATGRYRDGGWSGQGPSLYAIAPWNDGSPPANCTHLNATTLLQYATTMEDVDLTATVNNYQHVDEWEGGAFITTASGKEAIVFAGTKGVGAKYWYGYINYDDRETPCVEVEMVGDFTVCRNSDGTACPESDLTGCDNSNDSRGWWSSEFEAQLIFYDPANLAAVADGTMKTYEPQPYNTLTVDDNLFLTEGVEDDMLGTGVQRRFRIGDIAYDKENQRLYLMELFADGTKPVIHVFGIE